MILISHRGNINGPKKKLENHPEYIHEAISMGYEVEVDVWFTGGSFYLGHDYPNHEVSENFLENDKIWCHSKNIESLEKMIKNDKIHCFWHQNDSYTLTSKKIIWSYPNNKIVTNNYIVVLPEIKNFEVNKNVLGICSDYIEKYNNLC